MNAPLPRALHAGASVALIFLAFALGWSVLIQPALSARTAQRERFQALTADLKRFGSVAAKRPFLLAEIQHLKSNEEQDPGYLQAPSDAQAAAAMQAHLQAVITKHGGNVRSAQPVTLNEVTVLPRVAVRVEAQGTLLALSNTFIELAHSSPVLVLDNVQIQPQRPGALRQEVPGGDQLEARFDLIGIRRAVAAP